MEVYRTPNAALLPRKPLKVSKQSCNEGGREVRTFKGTVFLKRKHDHHPVNNR